MAACGAAPSSSPPYFHEPTVPLSPLLLCLVVGWLVARPLLRRVFPFKKRMLLARSFEQKVSAWRHGGIVERFEPSREELEAQSSRLKERNGSESVGEKRGATNSKDDRRGDVSERENEGDMGGGGMRSEENDVVVEKLRERLSQAKSEGAHREAALRASLEAEQGLRERLSHENALASKRATVLGEERAKGVKREAELRARLAEAREGEAALVELVEQLEERARRLEEENVEWEENAAVLEAENAEMDKEMDRLVDEMDAMCNKNNGGGELEGEELEQGNNQSKMSVEHSEMKTLLCANVDLIRRKVI